MQPQAKSETGGFPGIYFEDLKFCDNRSAPVFHGYFGRQGGYSTGIYASLNCGVGSKDEAERVAENRKTVAGSLGVEPGAILTLMQVHGGICLYRDGPSTDRPEADAHVTDRPGLALGVLTADCAPVLFYGSGKDGRPVIGAAHAGWKGAVGGVMEATLAEMERLGAARAGIRAGIGPCIGPDSYEVSQDFTAPFLKESSANESFFREGKGGRLYFNLPGYVAAKLLKSGVGHVAVKDIDTYFNEEDFFSFRRTTHRRESDYGRQISLIMIR